jgi:hypothetical protein
MIPQMNQEGRGREFQEGDQVICFTNQYIRKIYKTTRVIKIQIIKR